MTIKNDIWIRKMAKEKGMISPFIDYADKNKIGDNNYKTISFGLSSYGYDISCDKQFHVLTSFSHTLNPCIDPKKTEESSQSFIYHEGLYCVIPSNTFVLATSIEWVRIPNNVLAICIGKSTYARCGILINATPIEPGFQGNITLEISNTGAFPVKVYANEGIAQLIFFESDERCEISYADKSGKYQNQSGVTHAKIDKETKF